MRSKVSLALLLAATLTIGIVVGYFLPWADVRSITKSTTTPAVVREAKKEAGIPLEIKQDGAPISVAALVEMYRANPNRFVVRTEKSMFDVEGRIAKVGEAGPLDDTAGFYLPLSAAANDGDFIRDLMSGTTTADYTVALFVKGLSKADLANFDAGELIKAKCPKIRVVTDNLVFDECTASRQGAK